MGNAAAGRYDVVRPLAAGGMAQLFLARRRDSPGQLVALKRILPHLAGDRMFVEMFLNEARVAATLHHPNLVSVLDCGYEDGSYYLAMEYVHGADLGELLESAAEADDLPLDVALTIIRDACAGLHHLHDQTDEFGRQLALVHRDVSPSNILVRADGIVKVTDFGIATATAHTRTTRPGTVKGKASYMSPEQCTGGVIDRRADVFALGILLFEATTRSRLFVGDNEFNLMMQVVSADIPAPTEIDPSLPPGLEPIILKALARNPADRYQTAAHLQTAIEGFAARRGMMLSSGSIATWFQRRLGSRPYPSLLTPTAVRRLPPTRGVGWALAATCILGLVGWSAWSLSRASMTDASAPTVPATEVPAPVEVATPAAAAPAPDVVVVPTPVPADPTPPAVDAEVPEIDDAEELDVFDELGDSEGLEVEEIVVVEDGDDGPRRVKRRRRPRRSRTAARPSYDLDQAAPPR